MHAVAVVVCPSRSQLRQPYGTVTLSLTICARRGVLAAIAMHATSPTLPRSHDSCYSRYILTQAVTSAPTLTSTLTARQRDLSRLLSAQSTLMPAE